MVYFLRDFQTYPLTEVTDKKKSVFHSIHVENKFYKNHETKIYYKTRTN